MTDAAATPLLVGAYATLPPEPEQQAAFYAGLREAGVDGLEIPDFHVRGEDGARLEALEQVLGLGFTSSVVTAIPSTMKRQGPRPGEGLASADEELRRAALGFVGEVVTAIAGTNDALGRAAITGLLVHSAPTGGADADAFRRSLEELAGTTTAAGLRLLVEHCDAASGVGPGEKRFLDLAEEIAAARELGVPLTINWGRSVVESHDPRTPEQQIRELAAAGLLGGIAFSGAGGEATGYGAAWGDVHLPLDADEPASLMTPATVRACLDAADGAEQYRAVKVQAPSGADVTERLAIIGSIAGLLR